MTTPGSPDEIPPARARGRPSRFTPPSAHDHLPLLEPLDNLSPTARAMLDAGRRLLAERGFRALTLEAVAHEAGTSTPSVTQHFGNRAGFLAILFDSLMQDASVEIEAALQNGPDGGTEAGAYMGRLAALYADVETDRAVHEIAANALQDRALRTRIAEILRWYRELHVGRLSALRGSDVLSPEELATLAALLDAIEDGLALHRGMDPEGFDPGPVFELLGQLMELYFADRRAAGETTREPE